MVQTAAAHCVAAAALMSATGVAWEDLFNPSISEQSVIELFEAVRLSGEALEQADRAFMAYSAESRRLFDQLRDAVGDIHAELQIINRKLHKGREPERFLFTQETPPPYDPDLLQENSRLSINLHNAGLPYTNAHIAAMRQFIDQLEHILAEADDALVHPRPRFFILSRFEQDRSGNVLDLVIPDMEQRAAESFREGALRDAVERLAAPDRREDGRFRNDLRLALNEYFLQEEARLTEAHLCDRRRRPATPEAQAAAQDPGQLDERIRRLGSRWTVRFTIAQQHTEDVARLLEADGLAEHADRWRREFQMAVAPEIFQPRWPLQMVDWLREQPEATQMEIDAAQRLLEAYLARLGPAQQRAYVAAQRASGVTGFVSMAFWESPEHRECHESLLALHLLGRDTLVQFRRMLSPALQERVGQAWLRKRRDIAGPWPMADSLDDHAVLTLLDWPDMPPLWGR